MNNANRLGSVDRRGLMQRALLLLGAAAVPVTWSSLADAAAATYLAKPDRDLLAVYAETLIPRTKTPGAIDAGVPQSVDAMLANWASAETAKRYAAALRRLDSAVRARAGTSLLRLSTAKRHDAIRAYDAERIAAKDPDYIKLRELVLVTYYLSEPGATQELRYEQIPGVWDAEMPLGKDRRAWAT